MFPKKWLWVPWNQISYERQIFFFVKNVFIGAGAEAQQVKLPLAVPAPSINQFIYLNKKHISD